MVALASGLVVLVRFPFSDLSSSKLRPAVVLAHAGGSDWVLCQVTSNPYGDSAAIPLPEAAFATGGLQRENGETKAERCNDKEAFRRCRIGWLLAGADEQFGGRSR